MKKILWLVPLFLLSSPLCADHGMNQESLERIVKATADQAKGEKGVVEFEFKTVRMYLISDPNHNRMRIVAPVAKYETLTRVQIDALLESNYHKALDARYAVSKGVLYSAYIHTLAELHEGQVRSAVHQVANLALSFGNDYSSGKLKFEGQSE